MRLDIMVPYWGDPAFMKETVNSVLAQDCPDWRLTVIDDAYPDPEIGQWMAQLNDPRITYVRNESNAGVVNNYRKCRAMATGELMMFMGCDDVLLPNYVSTVL
jgi:glycosyltransferase involved in cell wall biosynthesis